MDREHVFLRVVNVAWIDLDRLALILHFKRSFGLLLGLFRVYVKQWLNHFPWLLQQYRWQSLLW
jgi:hypothetical protein